MHHLLSCVNAAAVVVCAAYLRLRRAFICDVLDDLVASIAEALVHLIAAAAWGWLRLESCPVWRGLLAYVDGSVQSFLLRGRIVVDGWLSHGVRTAAVCLLHLRALSLCVNDLDLKAIESDCELNGRGN